MCLMPPSVAPRSSRAPRPRCTWATASLLVEGLLRVIEGPHLRERDEPEAPLVQAPVVVVVQLATADQPVGGHLPSSKVADLDPDPVAGASPGGGQPRGVLDELAV